MEVFQEAVREAVATAATGKIVTIGITPDASLDRLRLHPPVRAACDVDGRPAARWRSPSSSRSPGEDAGRKYLASGDYLWNAGMFVAPVGLMLRHLGGQRTRALRRA